ncbi:MAG: glycerate kinase [Chloroflexi bacterium HGW-Chloroflexi-6]|nr:MAG: glycerate kinase [Chloroflexi bacterium HGW-Chloroflexi-6]
MHPERFLTTSLRSHPRGESVMRILSAAMRAVEPDEAVRRFVQREGQTLIVAGQVYDLEKTGRIRILGLGKAARAMTDLLAECLAGHTPRGLLIPKQAFNSLWAGFEVQPGGHPIPNQNSLQAAAKALELVQNLSENDLLICLVSGGGSALMSAPQPGLTLYDLQSLTCSLLACGARIDEINTLRRHLDRLKGGGLARAAAPAQVISLILSDVVGSPLEAIASGPTAPDPTSKADALGVLKKYDLTGKIPSAIFKALENAPETPKPGDGLFARVQNFIVGSNLLAAQAALAQAKSEGFIPHFWGAAWQGEARDVAKTLCKKLKSDAKRPFCMVAGGETTVTLRGAGLGGRNQELALAAVNELAGVENVILVTLATDGEDGPTDAAGAVVTGDTKKRAQAMQLDPDAFLNENDAYHFFEPLGDLLQPGPSGTNVNDLIFLFGF